MKTFSFVAAASNSGKTTLIEKVVGILKTRGFRVAVVKHTPKGFAIDRPGKDSWRFQQAGADCVVVVAPGKMSIIQTIDHEPESEELEKSLNADIVIYEGFKDNARNKIEVFRMGVSGERPLCCSDPTFIALASDGPFDVSIPRFDLNDAAAITEFLIENMMKKERCNL